MFWWPGKWRAETKPKLQGWWRRGLGGRVVPMLIAALSGCGTQIASVGPAEVQQGVLLTDSGSGWRYVLEVTAGSPVLAEASGVLPAAAANPELADVATGTPYVLSVSQGALTLQQQTSSTQTQTQLGLSDTVTRKRYALEVVRGALTLIPG